jgi:O-antigen ligase
MIISVKNLSTKIALADIGLSWILFFSIVYQKIVPIGFGLMLLSLVFVRQRITKKELISFFSKGLAMWFILYYFLLVIGLLWTENQVFAFSKLENKMAFILMPILLLFTVRKWGNYEWKKLLIYALLFALVMYEILAMWRYIGQTEHSWEFEFLSSRFTIFMHRSYFACYLVIGIILLVDNLKAVFSLSNLSLIIFFSIGVIQTGSKAGVVCLMTLFLFQLFSFVKSKNTKFNWVLSFSIILFSIVLFTNNPIKTRFETMWSALGNVQITNNNSVESNTARIIMWSTSLDVWRENFVFGTGTGDYDDELTAKNLEYKNLGVAKERLNSHNQFLNSAVQLGLVGFFVLLMIFISSYFFSEKKMWQVLILVVFLINFLVESFLETQAGIILFCTLLLLFYKRNKDEELSIIN